MSTGSNHSPLLALPKELRLMIYDKLFTLLIQRPKHFDTYVLPSEWPKIDFTSYRALLLTCKEVKEEATTHFEGHFLRDVMVYFDRVNDLRDFYSKLERASDPEKLTEMWVCVHTLPEGIQYQLTTNPTASRHLRSVNLHTKRCFAQVLIDNDNENSKLQRSRHPVSKHNACQVTDAKFWCRPLDRTHKARGSANLDVLEWKGRSGSSQTTFDAISRQVCSKESTSYSQMVAPISCLGGHEGLPKYYRYRGLRGSALDEEETEMEGFLWPGTKEFEQELKEKYELDA